ncbi:hypothetical protein HDU67_004364, partial [Dinochytrium kinnereticum]
MTARHTSLVKLALFLVVASVSVTAAPSDGGSVKRFSLNVTEEWLASVDSNLVEPEWECNGSPVDRAGWLGCEHRMLKRELREMSKNSTTGLPLLMKRDWRWQPSVGWYWSHKESDKIGGGEYIDRFCTKVTAAGSFIDWDVRLSPVVGRGMTVAIDRGVEISETKSISAGLGADGNFGLTASVGYEYSRTWSTSSATIVSSSPVQMRRGCMVHNPLTYRTHGTIGHVMTGAMMVGMVFRMDRWISARVTVIPFRAAWAVVCTIKNWRRRCFVPMDDVLAHENAYSVNSTLPLRDIVVPTIIQGNISKNQELGYREECDYWWNGYTRVATRSYGDI